MRGGEKVVVYKLSFAEKGENDEQDKTRDPFVTENAIGSISGCVDIFISTVNTIFGNFPLLKEVPKYRQSIIEIMLGLREYTKIVEEELK